MALTLHWTLSDPAKIAKTFDAIKVYRSATADGAFAEVTTPQTRPQIRPDQARYTYIDPDGSADAFYASSYYGSLQHAESSRSEPQRGAGDPVLALITPSYIRDNYLWGMKLTDRANRPLPDGVFLTGIRMAVAWAERVLGFDIIQKARQAEPHDYRFDRQTAFGLVHTDNVPVASVQGVRLSFPNAMSQPFNVAPAEIRFNQWEGSIQWVPSSLSAYPAFGALWSGVWRNRWIQPNAVPGSLLLSYTSGFEAGKVPADILDLVCKIACLSPLSIAGDLIGPPNVASQSIGLDGLSQSVSKIANQQGNAYASRMSSYLQNAQADAPKIKSYYLGLRLRAV